MSTNKKNVDLFKQINEGFLHKIGPDGRYNRDRIFASLGIPPGKDGDYGRNFGLNDQQRKQVKAAIEKELGIKFPGWIEIDPAGNMNENEGLGKQVKKWGPIVGGAAAAAFGVPGLFPGLLSGGGGAAGAGAAGAASGGGSAAGTARCETPAGKPDPPPAYRATGHAKAARRSRRTARRRRTSAPPRLHCELSAISASAGHCRKCPARPSSSVISRRFAL